MRNTLAHPDTRLFDDIIELLNASTSSGSEASSDGVADDDDNNDKAQDDDNDNITSDGVSDRGAQTDFIGVGIIPASKPALLSWLKGVLLSDDEVLAAVRAIVDKTVSGGRLSCREVGMQADLLLPGMVPKAMQTLQCRSLRPPASRMNGRAARTESALSEALGVVLAVPRTDGDGVRMCSFLVLLTRR